MPRCYEALLALCVALPSGCATASPESAEGAPVPVYLSYEVTCPYESLGKVSAEIAAPSAQAFADAVSRELGALGRSEGADAVIVPAPEGRLRIPAEPAREGDLIRQRVEGYAVSFTDSECR